MIPVSNYDTKDTARY